MNMFNDFANKIFRDEFLEENIKTRLALQVRALREKAKLSRPELGELIGTTPSGISRIEDPNYGKFTIRTLLKLASAFDVALFISFVPYTKLIMELKDVSPDALAVSSYKEEKEVLEETSATAFIIEPPVGQLALENHQATDLAVSGIGFLNRMPTFRVVGAGNAVLPVGQLPAPFLVYSQQKTNREERTTASSKYFSQGQAHIQQSMGAAT